MLMLVLRGIGGLLYFNQRYETVMKEGRRGGEQRSEREGEEKKQRVSGLSFTPKEVET